jgi:hypothetical protein
MRTLLVLAALATLTACGGGDSDSRRDRDQATSERDRDRDSSSRNDERSSRDEDRRREVDPDLEDELRADVRQYRETLPAREGPLTITDVDLDGTEIIYTGRLDANFDRAAIAEFRRTMSRDLCTGEPGQMIRRGGSFTYNLRDEDGDEVDTTVSSCD